MPAEQSSTTDLPAAVATVSDCLADFLAVDEDIEAWQKPLFEPWHRSFRHAANAVRNAPPNAYPAHVLSMSVPATWAPDLAGMLTTWIGDLPHPLRMNLAHPAPAPPGTTLGFEVLGFEAGRFHSWLCYRLDIQARDKLGIRPGDAGLLTTLSDARQVADMANSNRGAHDSTPEEVTWFPALLTERLPDQVTADRLNLLSSASKGLSWVLPRQVLVGLENSVMPGELALRPQTSIDARDQLERVQRMHPCG